ncbi:DgyrCDS5223 [Dimorphilus gyrociliatus]|uniref:DgyrCDS5223 n=1 Tax=Dimorphilus gyrociliatus TaxID=2664684 RepID=A0A7I8VKU7_9ANNE|nr:DgyrCDS5223 [Dimorphilus gyrociliatus]
MDSNDDDTFNFEEEDYNFPGRDDMMDEVDNQILESEEECRNSPKTKIIYKRQMLKEENEKRQRRVAELERLSENDREVSQSDLERLGLKKRNSDHDSSISDDEEDDDVSSSDSQKSLQQTSDNDERSSKRQISPIEPPTADSIKNASGDNEDREQEVPRQSSKLKYIFKSARFYMMKSNNHENIALAKAKGVWSTPPQNEIKLNRAYQDCRNVILIFSVKESGKFQGFARVRGPSDKNHPPIRWVLPGNISARALSGVFTLDWINRRDLPFSKCAHLQNTWNENKPVKIGRDGQEIEPVCGEALCRLFPPDENIDLREIAHRAKSDRNDLAEENMKRRENGQEHLRQPDNRYQPVDHPSRYQSSRHVETARWEERREPRDHERYRSYRTRDDYGEERYREDRRHRRTSEREDYDRRREKERYYSTRRSRSRERDRYNNSSAGVRKETMLHGSYEQYVREYEQRSGGYAPSWSQPSSSSYLSHSSYSYPDYYPKHKHERDVDQFLRSTGAISSRCRDDSR